MRLSVRRFSPRRFSPRHALMLAMGFWLMLASAGAFGAEWHPLTIQTRSGAVVLDVEVADTPALRARGLMFRTDLKRGQGMLFVFEHAHRRSFWMKNTPLSLDILFFDSQGRFVGAEYGMVPFSEQSILTPPSMRFALELPHGHASDLGLGEGLGEGVLLCWPLGSGC